MPEITEVSFDQTISLLMCIATMFSVFVSAWAVSQSQKSKLTETYFSEMVAAYADFISAVNNFAYNNHDPNSRDSLSATLLKLQMFASDSVNESSQRLYVLLLDWASAPREDALQIDGLLQALQKEMQCDLEHFRRKGHHR